MTDAETAEGEPAELESAPSGDEPPLPEPPAPSRTIVEPIFNGLFRLLTFLFVDGPDPVEHDDPEGVLEVLLPWPVRLAAVGSAILAAYFWRDSGVGQQVAWGLQIGGLCAVAIIAAFWMWFVLVDCVLAAAWLVPFEAEEVAPHRWQFLHAVTSVNRQVEHVKALLVWMLVAFTATGSLTWQVGIFAAVLLLGLPIINGVARTPIGALLADVPATKRSGGLYWRRRVLIYAATMSGLVALMSRAPGQVAQVMPLFLAFACGLALRALRHALRSRDARRDARDRGRRSAARGTFRKRQAQTAARMDPWGVFLALTGMAAVVGASWYSRKVLADELGKSGDGSSAAPPGCTRDHDAPAPDIALFLMADTQTHELSGEPFPGQTELAVVFSKTATRPVTLDMLSSVPVKHFLGAYQELARQRRAQHLSPPYWAHLGDMADIGCKNELERMFALLEPFSEVGPLASVAVGNHETSFEGSFHWSPYWDMACKSGRMRPDDAVGRLQEEFTKRLPQAGAFVRIAPSLLNPSGAVLTSVVPLGATTHHGQPRNVIGVFLDTMDGRAFDWGNPGSIGSISEEQIARTEQAITTLRQSQREAHGPPAYVLFAHVPFDALASDSQKRVEELVTRLDEKPAPGSEPNVLAMISAHTHVAGSHQHCIDGSFVREIVLGSTVDPPQQAAVVEIGPDSAGRISLGVRTLATVARAGLTCGDTESALRAQSCRAVSARLRNTPACRGLFATDPPGTPLRDCVDLEQPGSFSTRLNAIRTYTGPRDLTQRRRNDEARARALLECICHDDATCQVSPAPLEDESYLKILSDKLEDRTRRAELVCLAWAAGAMQAHKDSDMTLDEAMRCSFDDPTVPAERLSVARLEATSCD